MKIKFIELLDKIGDGYTALFDADRRSIKIGVSDTLLSIWNIQGHQNPVALFLKQFGMLKIQWMLIENNLHDYIFISDHFKKDDGSIIRLEELDDYLKNKIIEVENKKIIKI